VTEHEKNGSDEADSGKKKVQSQLFFHVKNGEKRKNDHRDDFLHHFELSDGVISVADAVCRDLDAVFDECDSPAYQDYYENRLVVDFQVPVPCQAQKNIRCREQEDRIKFFHFLPQKKLNGGILAEIFRK